MATMDDNQRLMQDFRDGRGHAFDRLMKQFVKPLTWHVYRLCRNKEVAEDIVAETFAKLWKTRENFGTEANVKSFLYIAARNASLDYLGSVQRRVAVRQGELDEDLVSRDIDPLTHIIHAELIQALVEETARLPERQGDVFRMTYLEGLTTEEICHLLGITPNAVFLAKKKATAAIRKAFAGRYLHLYLALVSLLSRGGQVN
ncbi:RNA polymerase sigma factor [Parapedobacter indicus]|uniref:RNA polymerase sigma-70 factor, ECF subfamily n=2 Tax=Parapedobacter indicus TaxID=1477437 RepID=A0A1I3TQU5_9SPHI|nr:sigma-70 family RNA polymerase sigma factor [Parapedobacter indicus]PPK99362.1 RNA polymerase sigma-70 factor (ECF subfamily) [Parapedobacter indicus]SFJ72972.1 RNA polymerase sigma-70 factor, ECF subfamily [Parapedobacter indicus]